MAEVSDARQQYNKTYESWKTLEKEFDELESKHQLYLSKYDEIHKLQQECLKTVKQHTSRAQQIKEQLRKLKTDELDVAEQSKLHDVQVDLSDIRTRLVDMKEELPREHNGLYLSIILGHINISLMNKNEKYRYKDEYEKFKFTVTCIAFFVIGAAYLSQFRVLDALSYFLLVWYYCTLTIREAILTVNGSRIKGWWVAHHYVTTVLCGVMLTWPDSICYKTFRGQYLLCCMYIAGVQLLQCQYQRSCLRRLRSLGQRHTMDITVDGFHSWMFKGLTFLLPFLVAGYVFQLYNAYTLFKIFVQHECSEWQVIAMALLFFTVAVGNSVTTWQVCWRKWAEKSKLGARRRLETKYSVVMSPRSPSQQKAFEDELKKLS